MTMIIVAGTIRIDPTKLQAASDAMLQAITKSRTEDGCVEYSYAVDVLDASLIHVFERWRDKAALQAHFETPHLIAWRETWSSFGIHDRKLSLFEVTSTSPL